MPAMSYAIARSIRFKSQFYIIAVEETEKEKKKKRKYLSRLFIFRTSKYKTKI